MSASKKSRRQSRKAVTRQSHKRAAKRSSRARKAAGTPANEKGRGGDTQSVGEPNRCRFRSCNLAWLEEYLTHVFVHDTRRAAALLLCLSAIVCRPTLSLNAAMVGRPAKKMLETLLRSPLFRFVDLVRGMARACVRRIADLGLKEVLIVQDTTSFNYSGHRAKKGFGPLGGPANNPGYGFFCHGSLAVSTSGVPLGLMDLYAWHRDPKATGKSGGRRQVEFEKKESFRWVKCLRRLLKRMPKDVSTITICDREADIWEVLSEPRPAHAHLLIRACRDRSLVGTNRRLFEEVRRARTRGYYSIKVRVHPTHRTRVARLRVQMTTLWLKASAYGVAKENRWPIRVTAIRVSEPNVRAGVEPIEWVLLTDMAVRNTDDARRYIRYYSYRWLIERFHYTIKSGCKLEKCQVATYDRMTKVLAMYAIVAWRYLWLTYITRARGNDPCTMALSDMEWRVLYRVYHHQPPPEKPVSLNQAMTMLAVIGGHSGRERDGAPGPKGIWTGLMFLYAYVQAVTDAWMEHPDARTPNPPVRPPRNPGHQRGAPRPLSARPYLPAPPSGTPANITTRHYAKQTCT